VTDLRLTLDGSLKVMRSGMRFNFQSGW